MHIMKDCNTNLYSTFFSHCPCWIPITPVVKSNHPVPQIPQNFIQVQPVTVAPVKRVAVAIQHHFGVNILVGVEGWHLPQAYVVAIGCFYVGVVNPIKIVLFFGVMKLGLASVENITFFL